MMTIQLIHTVYNEGDYLKHYGRLFGRVVSPQQLTDYVQINTADHTNQVNKELQKFLQEDHGESYPLLPVFTPKNTAALVQKLKGVALATSNQVEGCLQAMRAIVGDDWDIKAHGLLVHVVLANLWQSIWLTMVAPNSSGSIAIYDFIEDCSILTTQVLPLSERQIFAYWQNRLQESNWILHKAFSNKHMIRMLRSIDDEGFMLPAGGVEAQLLEMKLIRTVRKNGSHVPSYKIATPEINKDDILAISQPLSDCAIIGYEAMTQVKQILLQERDSIFPKLKYVEEGLYLQACYSIWAYAIYQQWLDRGLLPKIGKVPNLFDTIMRS